MEQGPKLFGHPVMRVLRRSDGELVGLVYQWNNGEKQTMWVNDRPVPDVLYETAGSR